jgi:hypothetical protein
MSTRENKRNNRLILDNVAIYADEKTDDMNMEHTTNGKSADADLYSQPDIDPEP